MAERARTASHAPGTTRWTFRSVATGLYLGIEGAARASALIMATRDETEWDVHPDREDPSTLRFVHFVHIASRERYSRADSITAPNGRLSIQLGDRAASPAKGTPVKLWEAKDGAEQRWRFEEGKFKYSCTA